MQLMPMPSEVFIINAAMKDLDYPPPKKVLRGKGMWKFE